MKNKLLPLFLAITMLFSIVAPSAGAVPEPEKPNQPHYFMKAVSSIERPASGGQRITTEIYGGLLVAEADAMGSFQFTLDYPKDRLRLVSLAPSELIELFGGSYDDNQESGSEKEGSFSYNAGSAEGVALPSGEAGMPLAVAVFEVLPSSPAGDVTISLKGAEIVGYRDKSASCEVRESQPVHIVCGPMLSLPKSGSAQAGQLQPTLCCNPAGKLMSVVYSASGRMLRCQTQAVKAKAGMVTIAMDLRGGSYVQAFLLDSATSAPLCPAAQMTLQ